MRFGLLPLVVLANAVLVVAQPAKEKLSINPPLSLIHPVEGASLQTADSTPEPLTNAKRFAVGLPPLSPRARHRHGLRTPHQGSKVDTARRSTSSPLPSVNGKCNLLAKAAGATLGYLSKQLNPFGEYGTFRPTQDGALEVSFSYSPESPGPTDLLATNGPATAYPYIGGAIGYSSDSNNLAPGSSNYAYIVGTKQTPVGSPAVVGDNTFGVMTGIPADYESTIWMYDPQTQAITAHWVNADGSAPQVFLLYANDGNDALLMTGDPAALNEAFGTGYPQATFTCAPTLAVQVPA